MIIDIGMNHMSAPVELRECFANDAGNIASALACIREAESIKEGMFISTCNRVEALFITDCFEDARRAILSLFARLSGLHEDRFISNLFIFEDMEAVRHIFRVASSLDSLVLGEPQILGQIKEAYHKASVVEKTTGVILNRLLHRAFHTAKRIRTETGISESAVSVSYAAVELAKKIFYGLKDKKALLVGAGEMAELAAKHLVNQGIDKLFVANRSFDRAVDLAALFNGKAILLEEMEHYLLEVDIVIASTGSKTYMITHDQVKKLLRERKSRPLFFIDIAVPRDVEPSVNDLSNAYVYDIDDLSTVVEENSAQRRDEAVKAERIIQEETIKFEAWLNTLEVVPTITALKEKTEALRRSELERSLSALGGLTAQQLNAVEALTVSIAYKIINDPILTLKNKTDNPSLDIYIDMVKKLFNLDNDNQKIK